jgi:hypothetical protein
VLFSLGTNSIIWRLKSLQELCQLSMDLGGQKRHGSRWPWPVTKAQAIGGAKFVGNIDTSRRDEIIVSSSAGDSSVEVVEGTL